MVIYRDKTGFIAMDKNPDNSFSVAVVGNTLREKVFKQLDNDNNLYKALWKIRGRQNRIKTLLSL